MFCLLRTAISIANGAERIDCNAAAVAALAVSKSVILLHLVFFGDDRDLGKRIERKGGKGTVRTDGDRWQPRAEGSCAML